MTVTGPVVLTSTVELPKSGSKAIVVAINRPDQMNCFNTEVVYTLAKIFSNIADKLDLNGSNSNSNNENGGSGADIRIDDYDEVAAVIFTGNGRSFCAGADLSNPPNPLEQSSDLPECLQHNPVYQMSRITVPIIGAIHGYVITGGFELALACDILVGDSTTKFRDTHVKFGLAPCWGLSQKLSRRIGPGRAKLLSYSARPINATLAHQWGLIDELVDANVNVNSADETSSSTSLERAMKIADDIGNQDLKMVRRYKKALEEGGKMDLAKGLQRERELGIAHYLEAINDGSTFENAKEFISNEERPRLHSKL